MAHPEQIQFFESLSIKFKSEFAAAKNVFEVGSQNINGTVRGFFSGAETYLGVDLWFAKDVDLVVPGDIIELPDAWADISISTECFEHASTWPQILRNIIRITRPGGLVILTMAGYGRAAHGTLDSEVGSSPFTSNYYKNLGPKEITDEIPLGRFFSRHSFEVNSIAGDTYFWGIRNDDRLNGDFPSPSERHARAQGQLSQAIARAQVLDRNLAESQNDRLLLQQRLDGEQLRAESERIRAESERIRAETIDENYHRVQEMLRSTVNERDTYSAELNRMISSKSWKVTSPLRRLMGLIRSL